MPSRVQLKTEMKHRDTNADKKTKRITPIKVSTIIDILKREQRTGVLN